MSGTHALPPELYRAGTIRIRSRMTAGCSGAHCVSSNVGMVNSLELGPLYLQHLPPRDAGVAKRTRSGLGDGPGRGLGRSCVIRPSCHVRTTDYPVGPCRFALRYCPAVRVFGYPARGGKNRQPRHRQFSALHWPGKRRFLPSRRGIRSAPPAPPNRSSAS